MIRLLLVLFVCFVTIQVSADEKFGPDDPFASIDGEPIFVGELNLILVERLRAKDLDRVPVNVQQATALILVRQHLALRSLRKQGGASLQAMIDRQINAFADDAKRRGTSLEAYAKKRQSSERSLRADLAWRFAWAQYLKSRLNDKVLKSFYDRNRDKYGAGQWEVSQIFLKFDRKDDTSIGVAESRINNIATGLRDATSLEPEFAAIARQQSDGGTAADGGKIGWVEGNGDLPKVVMNAVREAKAGQLAGPVKSPMGFHLVLVHQYKQKDIPFDQLSDHAQLRRDAADALFQLLLKEQQDAKIAWYIGGLKPPANQPVIPQ